MKLIDYNNYVVGKDVSHLELSKLDTILAVPADKPWYSKKYRAGLWDGKYRLLQKNPVRFPSGLIPRVKHFWPSIEIQSSSILQCSFDRDKMFNLVSKTPFEHQAQAVASTINKHRGIIQAPTASGKTVMIAMLCGGIQGSALVLTYTKNLLYQTKKDIEEEIGEEVGIVGDGKCEIRRVTVGLIKSAQNNIPRTELQSFNMVVVDEAHHCSAPTTKRLLLSMPAFYRYGFSADALDMHGVKQDSTFKRMTIVGCLGPVIHDIPISEMKEKNIIATPIVNIVKISTPYKTDYYDTGYQEAYCRFMCANINLHNAVITLCNNNKGKSILVLTKHIHHGKLLAYLLAQKGISCDFLSGQEPATLTKKRIKDFKERKFQVLVGSPIFTEGVDIPQIDVMINSAGDIAATKQRLGRALRKKAGNNRVLIYDFFLEGNKYTERHLRERISIYKNDGHTVI